MPWQLAIMFSVLANAVTNVVQRRYSLKSVIPETIPSALSYLLGVMPVGITVGLVLPHHINWSSRLITLLVICGASMAVSGWIGFKAVKLMPVAPYQTISRFTSVVAISLGWIILDEKLTKNQLIGALVLLIAAVIAIWSQNRNSIKSLNQVHLLSVLLTLIACTFLAIGLVSEKAILGHVQVGAVLIIGWGSQTLAMLILMLKDMNHKSLAKIKRYEIKWSSLMGLANGITGAFYVYALNKSNNISVITALTAVSLPITVIGARYILKERENNRLMWFSVSLCFVGLLIGAI
jgi:drug/metabolite transporter (DMT)-like permease